MLKPTTAIFSVSINSSGIKPHIKVSIRLDEAANIASIDIQQKDKDDGSVHEQSALLSGGEIYLVH